MTSTLKRSAFCLAATTALVTGVAGTASAQPVQDGLVNVNVGDVTILEDVNVALAAQVAANICGVNVGPVAVLGRAVDRSGAARTVCENNGAPVTFEQN
ncbi:hypothetical protein SAMN05660464_4305 [Geodermatophilus dictyosporus]|uniref:Secreted protein n=1 Tax=Geodermatophilus dictyosporus TaxID=1523247 RepID=A0A1I5T9G6_9ACTN|nr:hypothetical protein [Geodermatophilus dictyosporus]SFP79683.1 hypothetical protein SAMN05660464_4305 [Geodermatophilus dictyosporus]